MSIGERIADLRKKQNMSQSALASAMQVSRQAVSKWESDRSSPDTLRLIRLAEVLNTQVEYLATGRPPVPIEPPITLTVPPKIEKVVETVVEKPVIRRVIRVRYLRNPIEFMLVGLGFFLLGLLLGIRL